MEIIESGRGDKRRKWVVYRDWEAREAGIDYKSWQDDPEVGDWIRTDDGYVLEVLRINRARDNNGEIKIYTTIKRSYTERTKVFKVGHIKGVGTGSVGKHRLSRTEYKRRELKEELFALLYVQYMGKRPDWQYIAYVSAYPEEEEDVRDNEQLFKKRIGRLLAKRTVRKVIMEQLKDSLERVGLTKEWYLRQLKKLVESSNEKVKLEALKYVGPILGVSSGKVSIKETRTLELDQGHIQALKETKKAALRANGKQKMTEISDIEYEEVTNE